MVKFNRILKTHSGFSMVQVMIAGALMVGVAMVGMRIQENQRKSSKGLEQSNEATSVFTLMSGILRGTTACTNTFNFLGGGQIPALGSSSPIYAAPILDAGGNTVFTPNQKYGSLIFKGIQVHNLIDNGIDLTANPAPTNGILEATILFERPEGAGGEATALGGRDFGRKLILLVDLNASVQFQSCYDMSSGDTETIARRVCLEIGATWGDSDGDGIFGCEPGSLFYDNVVNQQAMCESLGFYWDNAESKCNKYVRGGHYGGCSKELLVDTTYKGTYNQVWPILDCSTNPPTCDVGFKSVQLAGGLVNVTPFGELRAELSSIWETWACSKE